MKSIEEQIKEEYDSMLIAVFPSEKRKHARRLVELQQERTRGLGMSTETILAGWGTDVKEDGE